MSDWRLVRLGSVLHVKHGFAFAGDQFSADLTGRPIVINIGNFDYRGGFRFTTTQNREYRGVYPPEFVLSPGDLLVVMTCQTPGGEILGLPGLVPDDGRTYLHNQRIGLVATNTKVLDRQYSYYLFLSPYVNRQLVATASGTKILHTSPQRIADVEVKLPLIAEQRAIAEVLRALDVKIEANRHVRTISRAYAASLFEFRRGAKGVPVGIGEVTTSISRGIAPRYVDNNDGQQVLNQRCIRDGWVTTGAARWMASTQVKADRIAVCGDVLVNSTGTGTLGRVGRWLRRDPIAVDGHVTVVKADLSKCPAAVLGYAMLAAQPEIADLAEGSTGQTELSPTSLASLEIEIPRHEVAVEVAPILDDCDRLGEALMNETMSLETLRDALLPKLLSGELRVRDAEALVEEAV